MGCQRRGAPLAPRSVVRLADRAECCRAAVLWALAGRVGSFAFLPVRPASPGGRHTFPDSSVNLPVLVVPGREFLRETRGGESFPPDPGLSAAVGDAGVRWGVHPSCPRGGPAKAGSSPSWLKGPARVPPSAGDEREKGVWGGGRCQLWGGRGSPGGRGGFGGAGCPFCSGECLGVHEAARKSPAGSASVLHVTRLGLFRTALLDSVSRPGTGTHV